MVQLPFSRHWIALGLPLSSLSAILAAGLLAGPADAQIGSTPLGQSASGQASQAASPASNPDEAWLKKTGALYYSSTKAGLSGFDCAVHPDWNTYLPSAQPGSAAGDTRIALLEAVTIHLHAHMQGGSTLDWSQHTDKPLDNDSTALLARMHETTEQTLEGFLQFWTPFVDGSVVPASAEGLAITHTGVSHTIHAEQGDTALTETFSSDLLLQHFDVKTNGISIQFQPSYQPTGQGLLVKSFQAHVQQAGAPPDQAEDMHVEIEYQTLEGFPIPSRLNMDTNSMGKFNFVLDGCTVSRLQKPEPVQTVKPALQ